MTDLQDVLDGSVAEGDLPFVVGMVADSGGVLFSGQAGEASPGRPAREDTVFRLFSMTKAVASIAATILVDRGQLDPDATVESILPDFARIQVLEGFDGSTPRLRPPRVKATVRHLATHRSGLEYDFWCPEMVTFFAETKHPPTLSGRREALFCPMQAEPGTRWGYGPSTDWLGWVVEAVAGRDVVRFCQEEIFDPLGMPDTVFESRPDQSARLASVSLRGADGRFAPIDVGPPSQPEFYGMGHALYGTAPDYVRLLRMVLNGGSLDGRRILSERAVAFFLADQMEGRTFRPMIASSPLSADFDPFPGARVTHGFGALRNEEDVPGRRRAGSQAWAGVLNTHFWFDPASDLAGVFMTQSLPFVEPRYLARYEQFERAAYDAKAARSN